MRPLCRMAGEADNVLANCTAGEADSVRANCAAGESDNVRANFAAGASASASCATGWAAESTGAKPRRAGAAALTAESTCTRSLRAGCGFVAERCIRPFSRIPGETECARARPRMTGVIGLRGKVTSFSFLFVWPPDTDATTVTPSGPSLATASPKHETPYSSSIPCVPHLVGVYTNLIVSPGQIPRAASQPPWTQAPHRHRTVMTGSQASRSTAKPQIGGLLMLLRHPARGDGGWGARRPTRLRGARRAPILVSRAGVAQW